MDINAINAMNEMYANKSYGTRWRKNDTSFSDTVQKARDKDETKISNNAETVSSIRSGKAGKAYSAVATGVTDDGKTSSINESLKKHPDWKKDVDGQLNAGLKYLSEQWKDGDPTEDMTMDEYKAYMTNLINNLPRDVSQRGEPFSLDITEEGWEQMKKDHDYEAWVVGHNIVNNSVHNPWASLPGYRHHYHTEHFGASIEEHVGQSWPMGSPNDKAKDDKGYGLGNWWLERHDRYEEWLKESEENSIKEKQEYSRQLQEYYKNQFMNQSMFGFGGGINGGFASDTNSMLGMTMRSGNTQLLSAMMAAQATSALFNM